MASDINPIIATYKKLTTYDLVEMSKKPETLRKEVVPFLQKELASRNKIEEAEALAQFINNNYQSNNLNFSTKEELREYINESIENGVPIEAIKMELQKNGVDFFNLIAEAEEEKKAYYTYLTELKQDDYAIDEIAEEMSNTFNLTQSEIVNLNKKLIKKGKTNIIVGYLLITFSVALLAASVAIGRLPIAAISCFVSGVALIVLGNKQKK
jgi:hypothetical protein